MSSPNIDYRLHPWVRAGRLRPGDVQWFAGQRMTVAAVTPAGHQVIVQYDDAPPRVWADGTELRVESGGAR